MVLNARDAGARGAQIGTRVTAAHRDGDLWRVEVGTERPRHLVSAPWSMRADRGSKMHPQRHPYRPAKACGYAAAISWCRNCMTTIAAIFPWPDGRIIFAIPYEQDFTLIGTTDKDHRYRPRIRSIAPMRNAITFQHFVSQYFARPVTPDQVVWTISGRAALYNDGAKSRCGDADHAPAGDDKGAFAERVWRQDHHLPAAGRKRAGKVETVVPASHRRLHGAQEGGSAELPVRMGRRWTENLLASHSFLSALIGPSGWIRVHGTEA